LPDHLPVSGVAAMKIPLYLHLQYIPKKRSMSIVSDEKIRMIQNRFSNRPRKRLEFNTPIEVFHELLKSIALRG
jgi:IS30 family transposase